MVTRRAVLRAGAGVAAAAAVSTVAGGTGATAPVDRPAGQPDWERLRRRLRGELVRPDDAAYDRVRRLHLTRYDSIRPQAVALTESATDVRDCLLFAQDNDLPLAVRSGGHSYAGWSTGPGLVVDVSRMDRVYRSDRDTVTIGAGAQTVDVLSTLAPLGVALPAGLCSSIGSGGYYSGGGIGWQTRKFGIACDFVEAAEVVLADGRIVHCDEHHEADLFWALRGGGGGNFGVVTRWRTRPFAVRTMTNFTLVWPWAAAQPVLEAVQPWLASGSDDLNCLATVELPDATEDAVPHVVVAGVWYGSRAGLDRRIDALVGDVAHQPVVRDIQEGPLLESMKAWWGCTGLSQQQCHRVGYSPVAVLPRDNHVIDRGRLVSRTIGSSGIAELLRTWDSRRVAGQFRYVWMLGMGGRANEVDRTGTAFVHRDTQFLLSCVAAMHSPSPDRDDLAVATTWAAENFAVIDRHGNGENYVAFPDTALTDWRQAYYAENYPSLVSVKRRYDRHGLFTFPHAIGT
jgi:hypothetical protein